MCGNGQTPAHGHLFVLVMVSSELCFDGNNILVIDPKVDFLSVPVDAHWS